MKQRIPSLDEFINEMNERDLSKDFKKGHKYREQTYFKGSGDRKSPITEYKPGHFDWQSGKLYFTWANKLDINDAIYMNVLNGDEDTLRISGLETGYYDVIKFPGRNIAEFLKNDNTRNKFIKEFEKIKVSFDEFKEQMLSHKSKGSFFDSVEKIIKRIK